MATASRPRSRDPVTPTVTSPSALGGDVEFRTTTSAEAARIPPFASGPATHGTDGTDGRGHRDVVEAYLAWCRADTGPADGRRGRYEDHLGRHAPLRLDAARSGLDRYDRYRELVDRTLASDRGPTP